MNAERTRGARPVHEFRRRTDTEAVAQETDGELRAALDTAGLGLFEYYPLSGEVRGNAAFREQFGLSADAAVNYNVFLVGLHPADRERVVGGLQHAMERQSGGEFRIEFRTAGIEDGSERSIAMSGKAYFNRWGEAARVVATTRDIGERRQPSSLQRRREDPFRKLLDNVNEGILLHDPAGAIVDMNERFLSMYGVSRKQLRKMTIRDISSPQNRLEELPRIWSRVLAGEKQLFEWKAKRPSDNSTFDVEVFLNRMEMDSHPLILATVRDISDRKRLEQELKENEERYRLLFDKSPLPKWVFDLKTFAIIEVNETATVHYGYSREEFLGLTLKDIRTPEEYEPLAEWVKTCCSPGERFEGRIQTKHRKQNGEIIDVDVRYAEIDYRGRRAGLVAIIDITERTRAEERLRDNEQRLRAMFDDVALGMVEVDEQDRIVAVNRRLEQILGYRTGELIGVTIHGLTAPEDRDVSDSMNASIHQGKVPMLAYEKRYLKRDGSRLWVRVTVSSLRDARGIRYGSIGTVEDISERKKAEAVLHEYRLRLELSLSAMQAGISYNDLVDPGKNYWNERQFEILGYAPGSREPSLATWEERLHPEDRSRVFDLLQAAMERKTEFALEYRVVWENGEVHWVKSARRFVYDDAGRPASSTGIMFDITERKRAEERLEAHRNLLETIVNYIPAAVTLTGGRDLRVQLINPAYRSITPQREMVGKTLDELWPETGQDFAALCRRVLETGEPYHVEDELNMIRRRPDGPVEKAYFSWSLHRVRLPGDEGWGILNTVWETTESKLVQESLRASEEKFRAVFEQAAVGMGRARFPDARWIDVNSAFCTMLGYSREEMLATPWPAMTHPDDVDLDLVPFRRMASGELESYTVEKRFIHKQRRHVWARLTLSLVRDGEGRPDFEIAVIEDITERKKAEEELRESRNRLEAVLESIPDAVFMIDIAGNITVTNEAYARYHRFKNREEATRHFAQFSDTFEVFRADGSPAPPESWATFRAMKGEKVTMDDYIIHRKDTGERWWGSYHAAPLREETGRVIGAVVSARDITLSKKAEEALRQSEERFRSVVENMSEGLMLFDAQQNLIYQNPASLRIHGFRAGEEGRIQQESLPATWEAWDRSDRPVRFDEWPVSRVFRHERFQNQVLRVRRVETGQEFYGSYNGSPTYDEEGKLALGFITIRDITEQVGSEAALAVREQRLRTLFDSGIIGIIYWNMKGKILDANDKFLEIMGYTRQDLEEGMLKWDAMTPTEYREADERALEELRTTGVDTPYEKEYIRKNGTRVPIIIGAALFDRTQEDGVAYVLDITDRKRAEDRLKQALAQAEEGRRILEAMMENIPMGITIADAPDVLIRAVSRYGRELTGRPRETLEGIPVDQHVQRWDIYRADGVTPAGNQELPLTRATQRGELVREEVWVLGSADGTRIPILCTAAPIRDASGRITGGVIGWQDIRERNRIEQERERLIEELQRSNAELQQFAYVASHDLQEPLRTVASYVELLAIKYQGKLDPTADRYIAYTVEGAGRMSALINDLLAYSRVGTRGRQFMPVDMNTVLSHALDSLRRAIRESTAIITAGPLPTVMGDEVQLRQLMQNLLGNAIKFRKPDVSPRIEVSAGKKGADYVLSVKDNGIGIEPRFFDRIFTIFQRLHTREEYPGTGVGLAICRRIVERHGGRIWVESTVGEGSIFRFTLPVQESHVEQTGQQTPRSF